MEMTLLSLPWLTFAAFLILGVIKPNYSLVESFSREIASRFQAADPFELVLFVFASNTLTATLVYVGSLALVLPGLAVIAFNGYLIGSVADYAINVGGLTLTQVLASLLPHGVIELPAFLSASSGGIYCLIKCRSPRRIAVFTFKLLPLVALLLLIAAFIEIFITPIVARAAGVPV